MVFVFLCHSKNPILLVFELRNFVRDLLNLGRKVSTHENRTAQFLFIIDGSCLRFLASPIRHLRKKTLPLRLRDLPSLRLRSTCERRLHLRRTCEPGLISCEGSGKQAIAYTLEEEPTVAIVLRGITAILFNKTVPLNSSSAGLFESRLALT